MTNDELRIIEKRWQNLRSEAVGGIAKQACVDVQAVIDELRRRDKAHRQKVDQEAAITGALLGGIELLEVALPTIIIPRPFSPETMKFLSDYEGEPSSRLNVAPLLAGQDIRLGAWGHWLVLHGDMAEVERILACSPDQEGLNFRRGDGVGLVGYADYERRFPAYFALKDLWDYLVANLPTSITISGWHNASYMTVGGQRKDSPDAND